MERKLLLQRFVVWTARVAAQPRFKLNFFLLLCWPILCELAAWQGTTIVSWCRTLSQTPWCHCELAQGRDTQVATRSRQSIGRYSHRCLALGAQVLGVLTHTFIGLLVRETSLSLAANAAPCNTCPKVGLPKAEPQMISLERWFTVGHKPNPILHTPDPSWEPSPVPHIYVSHSRLVQLWHLHGNSLGSVCLEPSPRYVCMGWCVGLPLTALDHFSSEKNFMLAAFGKETGWCVHIKWLWKTNHPRFLPKLNAAWWGGVLTVNAKVFFEFLSLLCIPSLTYLGITVILPMKAWAIFLNSVSLLMMLFQLL